MKFCTKCQKDTERATNGGCRLCAQAACRRYHARNKEKRNLDNAEYQKRKAVEIAERKRAKYDRASNTLAMKKYRKKNPEKIKEIQNRSYRKNPGLYISHALRRQAREITQTPAWADTQKINQIYKECAVLRDAGIDVEVDHEIPLKGKLVSGLHVPENLRIITKIENRSKHNRYEP